MGPFPNAACKHALPFGMATVLTLSGCGKDDKDTDAAPSLEVEVSFTEPTTPSFRPGTRVLFKVEVTGEMDLESLTAAWDADGQPLCDTEALDRYGRAHCEWNFDTAGDYEVVVTIADGSGATAEASVDIEIYENEAPTFAMDAPTQGKTYATTDAIPFGLTADDDRDALDDLTIQISSNVAGVVFSGVHPDAQGVWTDTASLPAGAHILTFEVIDTDFGSTTDQRQITVQ